MRSLFALLCFLPLFVQAQIVTTIGGVGTPGYTGDGGPATSATFNAPWGLAIDGAGNLYVGEFYNHCVRKISTSGIITTVAGIGTSGFSGDGFPATTAKLYGVTGVAVDAAGNLYIADNRNNRIRMVNTSGIISTFAGTGIAAYSGDGGPATAADVGSMNEVSVDVHGDVYIPDQTARRVRKVLPSGIINSIAGNGMLGYSGDGGPATLAKLNLPNDAVADAAGNVYIAEFMNNIIRKVDPSGIISTVAGTGTAGYSGDGGPATAAKIRGPAGIDLYPTGEVVFCDADNHVLRKISASGIITTIAGIGIGGYNGDGAVATATQLNRPSKIVHDVLGNIYVMDMDNIRVRKIAPDVAPISGATFQLCVGATITLSDATAGGTWSSSSTAIATIGSISGIVTGISPGVATISYAASPGTVIDTVTVLPLPSAGTITGPSSVCVGSSAPLTDAVTGGAWSCSNTAKATISTGGIVTGVSLGTTVITYSVIGTCGPAFTTKTITVTTSASAGLITGLSVMCAGSAKTLTDAVAGGLWTSGSTSIAVVGSGTGTVTGVAAGTSVITYTVSDACGTAFVVKTVTVNPMPGAVSGNLTVCVGATTSLSNGVTGGVWSSINTAVATVGSGSGIVTGLSVGTTVITYTVSDSCKVSAVVTVTSLPDAGIIAGPSELCIGKTIALTDNVAGGVWSSSSTAASVSAGVVQGLTAVTVTISYTVTNSCGSVSAIRVVTVLPLPDPGIISGLASVCKGGVFTLSETVAGGIWSSLNNTIASVGATSGIVTIIKGGSAVIMYTVTSAAGCISSATVTVAAITIPPYTVTGIVVNAKCFGASDGSINTSVSGSIGPFKYLWSNSDTLPGLQSIPAGSYTLQVKDISTQCTDTKTFVVTQPDSLLLAPVVLNNFCKTGNGSIRVTVSGGAVPYQYLWSNSMTGTEVKELAAAVYSVTVTDANNCAKSFLATVTDTCDEIKIPDIITPNGDGVNDVWFITGISSYPGNVVQLFDKWGDVVYEKNGYANDWAGQGKGRLLPDGTYFYLLKLNGTVSSTGTSVFTGTIMIKR